MFLLLFFEPLSIAFETLQAIVIHGFQLLDIWFHDLAGNNTNCQRSKLLDISTAGAIVKRIKGFIRLKIALGALHGALPDATPEEIEAYDDECAICREPMAKVKRLSCKHLFHLTCLRSWYDLCCLLRSWTPPS
ncbi:E3 ubiquitin protein ligase RIN2-like isoform X2 [Camellia sinensis]|uniref:E3 ubiquitin protein ligase RIN2-like isoform X2 n=1 Tax=Camellia sinensis TaxID=4442 RepID=UPI0010356407|nr:E3 ubiquitin protein ligase RIN2-like isoform X2 [Camellia sinensis]